MIYILNYIYIKPDKKKRQWTKGRKKQRRFVYIFVSLQEILFCDIMLPKNRQEDTVLELKWFGEHRALIEKLILFGNSYARTYKMTCPRTRGFDLSASEIQVIEYLLENEEQQENMVEIAKRLGISASSFTNVVFRLTKMGLLKKYHLENNRKAVIVLVSDLGKQVYEDYTKEAYEQWIAPVTDMLKDVP